MRFEHVAVFAALFLASCAKKKEEPWLYYSSGAGLNDAVLYVNGNPTNQGKAFSRFVIRGVNWVELTGVAGENGYRFSVVKTPGILSPSYRQIIDHEESQAGIAVHRRFSFNETAWWHWAWQDADEIEKFDARDLSEIKAIVRDAIEQAKRPKFKWDDLLRSPKSRLWSEDPELVAQGRAFNEKASKAINGYAKLVYRECRPEDLVASVGRQLVMLKAKEGPIFFVGNDEATDAEPRKGEVVWSFHYGADEMFFAKFNGEWTWLVPTS